MQQTIIFHIYSDGSKQQLNILKCRKWRNITFPSYHKRIRVLDQYVCRVEVQCTWIYSSNNSWFTNFFAKKNSGIFLKIFYSICAISLSVLPSFLKCIYILWYNIWFMMDKFYIINYDKLIFQKMSRIKYNVWCYNL